MKVTVVGLWHLGSVTAACLAEHFPTVGLDPNEECIAALNRGVHSLFEPGLDELAKAGVAEGNLRFRSDRAAVSGSNVVWITFDTPVDENDQADFDFVRREVEALFPFLDHNAVVLISSQVPAGFTAGIAARYRELYPSGDAGFAYSPENLRLGQAIQVFREPDRVVVGLLRPKDREILEELFEPFTGNVIWMSAESAEMTKHALNAFLATSVVFINEIAELCEAVGADAREVEQGLKSESRIGPRAYLRAGGAFAGGTLARDIAFLGGISQRHGIESPMLRAVASSNDRHKSWAARKLEQELDGIAGLTVAVLGLTYKPGTDTLRRSPSIELCRWLVSMDANVRAHDPRVRVLPEDLAARVTLADSAAEACRGADAAVIGTPCPEFRAETGAIAEALAGRVLIDALGFFDGRIQGVRYRTVGRAK